MIGLMLFTIAGVAVTRRSNIFKIDMGPLKLFRNTFIGFYTGALVAAPELWN